jgi:hypothetical protein
MEGKMRGDHTYELMRRALEGVLPCLEAMTRTAKNPSGRKQLMAQVDQVRQALRAAEVSGERIASHGDQIERATSSGSEAA